MAEEFPLSDTISFQTREGWYDLIVTTAYIPSGLSDDGRGGYRTAADLHAPHTEDGTATLLQGLVREYADAVDARLGHAETVRQVENRSIPLPIPDDVLDERKLRG